VQYHKAFLQRDSAKVVCAGEDSSPEQRSDFILQPLHALLLLPPQLQRAYDRVAIGLHAFAMTLHTLVTRLHEARRRRPASTCFAGRMHAAMQRSSMSSWTRQHSIMSDKVTPCQAKSCC